MAIECPEWLVPLLAEPKDESWKKLFRHGRSQHHPTCYDYSEDGNEFWPTHVTHELVIELARNVPVERIVR